MNATEGNSGGPLRIETVEPTVFFVHSEEALCQGADLTLVNNGAAVQAAVEVCLSAHRARFDLGTLSPGTHRERVYVPDIQEPTEAIFTLQVQDQTVAQRAMVWLPQRHWEVYVVHGSHHDLGYTDLPSNVLREHDGFLDDVVRYCEETADWPEASRFRYVVEQSWSVLHYVEHHPPEAVERLMRLVREGRIEVTALFGNETSELCGHEEQVRLVYPSFRLKRRFGIPICTAELNDVPGLSWGLVSVLAGAGVRYFAPSIPDYFSWDFQVRPFWDEDAVLPRDMNGAFWWEGPDGDRVLFWYEGCGSGGLWTYPQAANDLPRVLASLSARGYPFDMVRFRFLGGHRDNAPPDVRLSLIAREWNHRWAYPRLIVTTNAQFFERLERVAGDQLRVLRGDLPNTDYTVGATSTARATGVNRLTHDVLPSAEKFATFARLASDYPYPADALAEAYDCSLLYDEHTWGMAHPVGPAQDACWGQKSEYAYRASALAQDILSKSTNRIADQIALHDDGYHIVVFNPLDRERIDIVELPAVPAMPCGRPMHWRHPSHGQDGPPIWVNGTAIGRDVVTLPPALLQEPFEIVDLANGESVPYQTITMDDPLAAKPLAAARYALGVESNVQHKDLLVDPSHRAVLVFIARDVPPLGYKTYRIVPTQARPSFHSSLQVGEHALENRYYRIELDPESGAIASLYDKELQREWVDSAAPHGFNQLVVRSSQTGEVNVPLRSRIERGEAGPVRASMVIRGDGPGCPQRTQEIVLYDGIKRIDLSNRLLKDATPLLEVYWAFPFAVDRPQFRYEASNAAIEPIRDQLPGSNSDAYAIQHWVSVRDEDGEMTWSSLEAPVVAMGGLRPVPVSQAHHSVTPPGYGQAFLRDPGQLQQGYLYSYALVNNFRTNFQPVQVGDMLFRYAVTSHPGDESSRTARSFGWSVGTPLVPLCVVGGHEGRLSTSGSFCQVDAENVTVLTIKGAEDGDGLVIRLAEMEGKDSVVMVTLPYLDIDQAFETNLVEEDHGVLDHRRHSVQVPIRANGLTTIRCRGARGWPQANRVAYH
jgi:alpha-mannosidase